MLLDVEDCVVEDDDDDVPDVVVGRVYVGRALTLERPNPGANPLVLLYTGSVLA